MKLVSTHCPKCNVLEKKLKEKEIDFEVIDDIDEVMSIADKFKIHSAPLLITDNEEVLEFPQAIAWLNKQ